MRNNHAFDGKVKCYCNNCGRTFTKTIYIEYVTNQRGVWIKRMVR